MAGVEQVGPARQLVLGELPRSRLVMPRPHLEAGYRWPMPAKATACSFSATMSPCASTSERMARRNRSGSASSRQISCSRRRPRVSIPTSCLCRWSKEAPAGRSQFWNTATLADERLRLEHRPGRGHREGDVVPVLLGGEGARGGELVLAPGPVDEVPPRDDDVVEAAEEARPRRPSPYRRAREPRSAARRAPDRPGSRGMPSAGRAPPGPGSWPWLSRQKSRETISNRLGMSRNSATVSSSCSAVSPASVRQRSPSRTTRAFSGGVSR